MGTMTGDFQNGGNFLSVPSFPHLSRKGKDARGQRRQIRKMADDADNTVWIRPESRVELCRGWIRTLGIPA
jgi:hypothetical protein